MRKECPFCGKIYKMSKDLCKTCHTFLITLAEPYDDPTDWRDYNPISSPESTETRSYCPQCNAKYYGILKKCPECNGRMICTEGAEIEEEDNYAAEDFWEERDSWEVLVIPQTYQEGFAILRYFHDHDFDVLPGFIFADSEPCPIFGEHIQKLEHNFSRTITPNPRYEKYDKDERAYLTIDNGYLPTFCIMVNCETMSEAKELLEEFLGKKKINLPDPEKY